VSHLLRGDVIEVRPPAADLLEGLLGGGGPHKPLGSLFLPGVSHLLFEKLFHPQESLNSLRKIAKIAPAETKRELLKFVAELQAQVDDGDPT
jgi:hypothetical protein